MMLTYPKKMFLMTYPVATTAATEVMIVWIVFLDFWIQGGDMRLRPRVFIVFIYPVLSNQMLRAATVVLNKFLSQRITSHSSYFQNCHVPSRVHFGLKVRRLHTQSNPLPKKLFIVVLVVQGRTFSSD